VSDLDYSVSKSVLAEAQLCPRGFLCLSDGEGHVRQAVRLVPGDGVFVPGTQEVDCPYAEKCADGVQCSCPVRIELFRKYGL
jgi:hypothetical protein